MVQVRSDAISWGLDPVGQFVDINICLIIQDYSACRAPFHPGYSRVLFLQLSKDYSLVLVFWSNRWLITLRSFNCRA